MAKVEFSISFLLREHPDSEELCVSHQHYSQRKAFFNEPGEYFVLTFESKVGLWELESSLFLRHVVEEAGSVPVQPIGSVVFTFGVHL